jgi:hypothetical protein
MSQPPAYTRQFDFSDFQSTAPATPLPGNQVDAELNAVKTTLDATLSNIAVIQRDDGMLRNQSVHPESISNATLTMLNSDLVQRGAWLTSTAYAVNDLVTETSLVYLCLVAHTSGTFATDLAAGKWALLTAQGISPDGSIPAAANIPMAGFKFTDLGAGSARTDSINLGQAQDMSIQWAAVSGTGDAIVLTLTPTISAYVAGMTWKFKATANNTGATTVNAGGGVIAVQYNGAALVGGEIKTGRTYELTYDGTVAQLSSFIESPVPIANGGTGQTTAANAFNALKQAATTDGTGVVEKATSAEVAAGTADKFPDAALIPAAPYIGRRNWLINGDFQVWQRGAGGSASFATPASGTYTADRWAFEYDGTIGTVTLSQTTFSGGAPALILALTGSAAHYGMLVSQTAAGSGQTLKKLRQRIENLRHFWSRSIRVSFVGFTNSGTTSVSLSTTYKYGSGGAPSTDEAGPTAGAFVLTTTPQRFAATLSIGSFIGKTFGTDGPHTSSLEVALNLPLNATFNALITDFQVEFGEATTPYDRRSFGDELRDCQRYFWKSFLYSTAPAQNTGETGSAISWRAIVAGAVATAIPVNILLPVEMRTTPTITLYNPSAANAQVRNVTAGADCSASSGGATSKYLSVSYTGTAGTAVNAVMAVHATLDAEL